VALHPRPHPFTLGYINSIQFHLDKAIEINQATMKPEAFLAECFLKATLEHVWRENYKQLLLCKHYFFWLHFTSNNSITKACFLSRLISVSTYGLSPALHNTALLQIHINGNRQCRSLCAEKIGWLSVYGERRGGGL